jgi:hypothetical protein
MRGVVAEGTSNVSETEATIAGKIPGPKSMVVLMSKRILSWWQGLGNTKQYCPCGKGYIVLRPCKDHDEGATTHVKTLCCGWGINCSRPVVIVDHGTLGKDKDAN